MSPKDLDVAVFRAVNGLGLAPLDQAFVLVSSLEFGLSAAAVIAAYFAWRKRWDAVWIILAGVLAVTLCDMIGARVIKPLFGRVRPCFDLPPGTFRQLVPIARSNAMPSLHAANNMAVALVALLGERRSGWFLIPLAIFVGLSRVGLGVHWPTDVLAGFAWGALCAGAGWGLSRLGLRAWRRLRGEPGAEARPSA